MVLYILGGIMYFSVIYYICKYCLYINIFFCYFDNYELLEITTIKKNQPDIFSYHMLGLNLWELSTWGK